MSSEYGKLLKITVFGQSHGEAVGVVMDGVPAGEAIDEVALLRFMARRRPGSSDLTTARREGDVPRFLSGLADGRTCGAPLCAIIENTDVRSGDYAPFAATPRPSHADYTALVKYGASADLRGGGHFSGRLTAPICLAGGIARQILARRGIYLGAHLAAVGAAQDTAFPLYPTQELLETLGARAFPALDDACGEQMAAEIRAAAAAGDSVGGVIACAAIGLPAGLGAPMFDGMENRLAQALFGIPAVRGVEFGAGFAAAAMHGSAHNDPFIVKEGQVATETNYHGGVLGGITTGMPLLVQVAVKPTPSIAREQRTVDLTAMTAAALSVGGRHDPCVALRAVPVVEAVTATVLLDMLLEERGYGAF